MTEILADVKVPYHVLYRPHRARTRRDRAGLGTNRKVAIEVRSATQAPPAFRLASVKDAQEDRASYEIRSFDRKLWWPALDRHSKPMNAAKFLDGLASGAHESVQILNPEQLWYSGYRPTFEEHFKDRVDDKILENGLENRFAEIQRGAAQTMLCEDTVHFAGGAPAFFGCCPDRPSGRSISLFVSNLSRERGPRLLGPGLQRKEDALWEGHVFDLSHLPREISLMESRGAPIELVHEIERVGDIVLKDNALCLCAHMAVSRLLGASGDISAAYRDLIPDRCWHDRLELVSLEICRTILTDATRRRWPENFGKRHLSLALTCAADVLARLELKAELCLTPEDEEALASMVIDRSVKSGTCAA